MSNVLKFLGNLLLVCVSIALALLACEMIVRFVYSDVTTTANMQTWLGQRWQREYVTKNSEGYREREYSLEAPPNTYRIAMIGDSFGYGQGLPVEDRFSNIIEAELNNSGQAINYEVLNFSAPGYTSADQLAALNTTVLKTNPDFILIQWLPNDFERSNEVRGWRRKTLIPYWRTHIKVIRHSVLYFLLDNQLATIRQYLGVPDFNYNKNLLVPLQDPGSETYNAAVQPMIDLVKALQASGIPYMILLHPLLTEDMGGDYMMQPIHDAARKICNELLANCLELLPALAVYGPDHNYRSYWVTQFDQHPNKEANRRVADYILQKVGPVYWNYQPPQ